MIRTLTPDEQKRAEFSDELFHLHGLINDIIGPAAIGIGAGEKPIMQTILQVRREIITATDQVIQAILGRLE